MSSYDDAPEEASEVTEVPKYPQSDVSGSGTVRFYAPAYTVFVSRVEGVDDITHEGTEVPADKAEAVRQAATDLHFDLMEG